MAKQKKQYLKAFVKQLSTDGIFEVVASTGVLDREGESIDPQGWLLENYMKNPVVLWAHNIDELPIGKATDVRIEEVDGEEALVITGEFASKQANPIADQVRLLFEAGIQTAVSVGFIPLERDGDTITKAELLELSFVPVPANPESLALAMAKNLNLDLFETEKVEQNKELAKDLLYGNAKKTSYYSKRSFHNRMDNLKKARKEAHEEVEMVLETELTDVAVELKEAIITDIESAIPALEDAAEKQLEGEPILAELEEAVESIVEKSLMAEVAPLADDIVETVEEVVNGNGDGEKQEAEEVEAEAEAEVEMVVELGLEEVASDIVNLVSKQLEDFAAEVVEEVEEGKRKQAEETVAEVIDATEKSIEETVEEVLEKNLAPIVSETTSAALEEIANGDGDSGTHEDDEEEKAEHEDDDDDDKDICDPSSPDYDPEACEESRGGDKPRKPRR